MERVQAADSLVSQSSTTFLRAVMVLCGAVELELANESLSHCQRTRAAALAGLHPEKVHLGLQQQPQLPCAAANLPERERLQREASRDQLGCREPLLS